jgi:hypothetical protein
MKKDEKQLKSLLQKNVSPEFDKRFWNNFNKRFEEKKISIFNIYSLLTAGAAMGIVGVITFYQINTPAPNIQLSMQNIELLENLEMLEELEEEMFDLSEEDWNELLAQN